MTAAARNQAHEPHTQNTFNTQNSADDLAFYVERLDGLNKLPSGNFTARCPLCSREGDIESPLILALTSEGWRHKCNRGCDPDGIFYALERRQAVAQPAPVWEAPVSFGDYTLPPFPASALPDWLRAFVEAEAARTQTPIDLAGMLALAVCAVAVASTHQIGIGAGWYEPLNLFTAIALPPGSRKSAVFRSVVKPLERYEQEENARRAPEIAASKTERDILSGRCEKAKQQAVSGKNADIRTEAEQEARDLAERLETYQTLAPLRLTADDCTQEKLASLLTEQKGRIAILSPEGGIFDIISGRYTDKTANMDVFLKGHAGDALRVDRVGRAAEYIARPALSLGLAIQPDVLQGLAARPGFRGRGLLGRFLFALPQSNIGFRAVQSPAMPADVQSAYEQGLRALLALLPGEDGEGNPAPHTLRLAPDALELFHQWAEHVEKQLRPDGELHSLADWGAKLCGATARIAGLLHLAEWGETRCDVSRATVGQAITLSKYLCVHALAAYDVMGMDTETEGARHVLAWIRRKGAERFSQYDAFKALRGRFKQSSELNKPLALLCERGYIREEPAQEKSSAGRPKGPEYAVNPHTQNAAKEAKP